METENAEGREKLERRRQQEHSRIHEIVVIIHMKEHNIGKYLTVIGKIIHIGYKINIK